MGYFLFPGDLCNLDFWKKNVINYSNLLSNLSRIQSIMKILQILFYFVLSAILFRSCTVDEPKGLEEDWKLINISGEGVPWIPSSSLEKTKLNFKGTNLNYVVELDANNFRAMGSYDIESSITLIGEVIDEIKDKYEIAEIDGNYS